MSISPHGFGHVSAQGATRKPGGAAAKPAAAGKPFNEYLPPMLGGGSTDDGEPGAVGSLPKDSMGQGRAQAFNEHGFFEAAAALPSTTPIQSVVASHGERPASPITVDAPIGDGEQSLADVAVGGQVRATTAYASAPGKLDGVAHGPQRGRPDVRLPSTSSDIAWTTIDDLDEQVDVELADGSRAAADGVPERGAEFDLQLRLGHDGIELASVLPALKERERRDLLTRLSALIGQFGFKLSSFSLNGLPLRRTQRRN